MSGVKGADISRRRKEKHVGTQHGHQRLMEVDNIKVFPVEHFLYLGSQEKGKGKAGNGTTAGNGAGAAYRYEPIAEAGNSLGSGSNNLDIMPHPGELTLKAGDMEDDTAGIGEIIWGD